MLEVQTVSPVSTVPTDYDTLLLVTEKPSDICDTFAPVRSEVEAQFGIDKSAASAPLVLPTKLNGFTRVVFSSTGRLDRDYDDVRRFNDAAAAGVQKALASGAKKLVLAVCVPQKYQTVEQYAEAELVSVLGAFYELYTPIELRETKKYDGVKLEQFSYFNVDANKAEKIVKLAQGMEEGRAVARDIGGSDPERMAPPGVAEYAKSVFKDTVVSIKVTDDQDEIEKEFPCMGAVNRAARSVKRHQGRVIFLEYNNGTPEETVCLVGKGICYDTGGADVKAGGHMAGMHRDKCGAAGIAGFFKTLSVLKPKNIRVLGALAMIRNSIGEESYVADEIITSRAGRRVRVGNTDAEGRMAMTDLLCLMKERIVKENLPNPHVYTVATLTGHACVAYGVYQAIMDNGPAKRNQHAQKWQQAGELLGEGVEISTIRREDYVFHTGKSCYEDILQCNNLPSSQTARGHQTPSAFLIMSSGMDEHGIDNIEKPIPYSHVDIAAAEGPFPGVPYGPPVLALTRRYLWNKL